MKKLIATLFALTLVLSACVDATPPTPSQADIQTAIAQTMVAAPRLQATPIAPILTSSPMLVNTLVPTTSPLPTGTFTVQEAIANLLTTNGFTASLYNLCINYSTDCKDYKNDAYNMWADIYPTGGMEVRTESSGAVTLDAQERMLETIISAVYGSDITQWVADNLTGAVQGSGAELTGSIQGYFLDMSFDNYGTGNTGISLTIKPIVQ